jgi:diguanylate cyclase (GGDEF)-like protein
MRFFRLNTNFVLGAVILVVSASLAGGTYWVVAATVDRMVRKDAEAAAMGWGKYLASNLTDLRQIAAGESPSLESVLFVERAREVGQVFRFKLFDAQGHLRLVSDDLGKRWDNEPKLAVHNPRAAAVVVTGQPHTDVKRGKPPTRPPLYAETYIPVQVDAETLAIVEVYLNQTDKQALFHEQFAFAAVSLAAMAALSFGVPGCALYWRSKQKQRADERIRYLAHYDALTGLLNRGAFVEGLEGFLRDTTGERIALHYVDLDHFKDVNDSLGHDVGDEILRLAAQRVKAQSEEGDLVARLGGDEFVIAQRDVKTVADVNSRARRILAALSEPVFANGHDLAPAASIGVAVAPQDGTGSLSLLRNADLALYAAKAAGRKTFRTFDVGMDEELKARLRMESLIRSALNSETFELFFQPIVHSDNGRLTGFEALLRLPNGTGGFISPVDFVPLAEEMGLIAEIGSWVLRHACNVAAAWPENLSVSVNLSPLQFIDGDLFDVVKTALTASGLNPLRLELEITEGLLLNNTDAVLEQLRAIKSLGVAIAMDDFGTGYSSLSYLWRFPFDKIKMDRSFMKALNAKDVNVANILRTIISLGHSLKMRVTAEGVETAEQARLLRGLACDYIQGFHYGGPMPLTDLAAIILKDAAFSILGKPSAERGTHTDAA